MTLFPPSSEPAERWRMLLPSKAKWELYTFPHQPLNETHPLMTGRRPRKLQTFPTWRKKVRTWYACRDSSRKWRQDTLGPHYSKRDAWTSSINPWKLLRNAKLGPHSRPTELKSVFSQDAQVIHTHLKNSLILMK